MIVYFKLFINYRQETVYLTESSWVHIIETHPEITLELIQETLKNPDVILMSNTNPSSELYFVLKEHKKKERFSVVVVKVKPDGLWVSTSMTKNKISGGAEIYRSSRIC